MENFIFLAYYCSTPIYTHSNFKSYTIIIRSTNTVTPYTSHAIHTMSFVWLRIWSSLWILWTKGICQSRTHKSWAAKFSSEILSPCGASVWNFLPSTHGAPRIFRWLPHFWTIYALLTLIIITVAIAPRKAYIYGEVKPGFPACGYEFSESVTKSNEASYFIKGDKFLDQEKLS
jgi:hypothetical protein